MTRLVTLALLAAGCAGGLQSMAWDVECKQTKQSDLDSRYEKEVAALELSHVCDEYIASLTDCPNYHNIWNRYHWASLEMRACQ